MADQLPHIPGFDVEAELGRGGMGIVYRVRRHRDNQTLALKMILRGRGATIGELARFRVEAEALTCLDHPNIVAIRGVGLHAGYPYLVLEFAERGSLRQLTSTGPQKPRWAAQVVRTVALAVQHAHDRGMLHRDLKSANVLLTKDGTPKVTDFGLVKFADPIRQVSERYCQSIAWVNLLDEELGRFAAELAAQYATSDDSQTASEDEIAGQIWEQCAARTGVLGDRTRLQSVRAFLSEAQQAVQETAVPDLDGLTQAGTVMGSPSYMAPEQAVGDLERIGPRTDVYAMGGILYEILTGRPPFNSPSMPDLLSQVCSQKPISPREVVPEISADIETVCLRCLEKRPEDRYQSATELADDLERFLDGYSPRRLVTMGDKISSASPIETGSMTSTVCRGTESQQPSESVTRSWWPFGKSRTKASGSSS